HYIEWSTADSRLGRAREEERVLDAAGERARARLPDHLAVGFDGDDTCCARGVFQGEPSVPAADLQHIATCKPGVAFDDLGLVPRIWISAGIVVLPTVADLSARLSANGPCPLPLRCRPARPRDALRARGTSTVTHT